jgi:hypothetical protein
MQMKLSENITGGETVGIRERLACRIILLITAAALYIDMDLFSIGSVVISVHKLAGLAGFPLALIVMGWRKLIIDLRIVLFGLLMLVTFNLFYVVEGVYDGRFYSAFLQIGLNGVIAVFLLTALKRDDRSFPFFMDLLIGLSAVSALAVLVQFLGNLSGEAGVAEALATASRLRVSGLLRDPNYEAAALLIGASALFTLRRLALVIPLFLWFSLGILLTFSRMGILGLGLLVLLSPFLLRSVDRERRIGNWLLWIIFAAAAGIVIVHPAGLFQVLLSRFTIVIEAFRQVGETNGESLLRIIKLKQYYHSILGFLDHPVTGIGGFNSIAFMEETIGAHYNLHNTYLEYLLAGGIWGLLMLGYLYRYAIGSVLIPPADHQELQIRHFLLLYGLIYSFVSIFLSYHLDMTTWMLLVLSLVYRDRAGGSVPLLRWGMFRHAR